MSITTDALSIDQFDRLPDEILEKIFLSLEHSPIPLTPNNHIRHGSDLLYFDYSVQQPLLQQTHAELVRISCVCRRFYQIIKSPHFWEKKCREDHVLLPDQTLPVDFGAYEKLYMNNPFHPSFNLIEEKNWRKSRYTHSQIERVPIGSHRLYDEFNRLTPCRITSYTQANFFQRNIQLPCKGLSSTELSGLRPVIEFSICIAARWDCGARCSVSLDFSDGHHWECSEIIPQWNDRKWHRLIYRYGEYEQFPTLVTVCLTGSDTQGWAGFYGMKFAQARLRLLLRTNENGTNNESKVDIEPKAEDELNQDPTPDPLPDNIPIDENSQHPYSREEEYMYGDESENEDEDNDA